MAKLDNVLNNTLREIEIKLDEGVKAVRAEARSTYFKGVKWLAEKQNRIEEINKEIRILEDESSSLTTAIRNIDPHLSTSETRELCDKYGLELNSYSSKKSDFEIEKTILKTNEYNNMKAFKKIRRQILNQFDMAITNKQKQQVIMSLQTSVDWKALGINIPNMFEITKVEVKWWKIIIDNALPSTIK